MADSQINHQDALDYWQEIPADVNGMLGGYPYISKVDLQGSKNFLAKLGVGGKNSGEVKIKRALDCGAGIGRITKGLLLGIAETVDIVEPIVKFSDALKGTAGVGKIFNVQVVTYLEKCGKAVTEGGLIIVKENMSTGGEDSFDEIDSSVTRTDTKFRSLFGKAKMKIKKTELQKGMPKKMYPVRVYALVPES